MDFQLPLIKPRLQTKKKKQEYNQSSFKVVTQDLLSIYQPKIQPMCYTSPSVPMVLNYDVRDLLHIKCLHFIILSY